MNSILFVNGEKPLQRKSYLKRADIENFVTEIAKEIHCNSSAPLKLRLAHVYSLISIQSNPETSRFLYEMRARTVPKHSE